MKPIKSPNSRLLALAAVVIFSITLLAWQQKRQGQTGPKQKIQTDTIPVKKDKGERKIIDLDEILGEPHLISLDLKLDELNLALEKINLEKELSEVNAGIEKVMIELDTDLVREKLEDVPGEIDVDDIRTELESPIKEIDLEKIKIDIHESIEKIDWKELKEELKKVKEVDISNIQAEMKGLKPELEKSLKSLNPEIEKIKKEAKEYKAFIAGLENDGLIDKKENYTIKHRDGQLIINGQVQPEKVYNKYRHFLEKHKSLVIDKTANDFDMDLHDDFD